MNLSINIDEDRRFTVNRINFTGNTTTRDDIIRREILIKEGQVFNWSLWDLSLARLNQLGYFDKIKYEDVETDLICGIEVWGCAVVTSIESEVGPDNAILPAICLLSLPVFSALFYFSLFFRCP